MHLAFLIWQARHRQQMPMAAAANEALADGWLQEAHELLPLPPAHLQEGPETADATDAACAAIAAQRAAVRALLKGVAALRCVCRPGAAPARLLRMLAKLGRELCTLAQR